MEKIYVELDKIIKCYDFIKENTKEYDNPDDILIILDIDNTITYTDCPGVFWPNIRKYYDIYKEIQYKNADIDINLGYLEIILTSKVEVFDKDIYKIIDDLKYKKLALTATITGSYLNCNNIQEFRYNQLKNNNISFENYFKVDNNEIIFNNFPKYLGSYPVYYKGILFSNSEKGSTNKGQLLDEFLKRVNYNPKCIILIDDNKRNHEYIIKELEQNRNNIKLINILYTGTYEFCPIEISQEDFISFWENIFLTAKSQISQRTLT